MPRPLEGGASGGHVQQDDRENVMQDERPVPVEVEFIADFACPWCYIGWRRLAQAATLRPVDLEVRWSPFLLNPHLPAEGMDRADYLRIKFGGEANAQRIYARIEEAGRESGIDFQFARMRRTPNTIHTQRLVLWSRGLGQERALVDRLFAALFEEGVDIGCKDALVDQAAAAGLDAAAARAFLSGDDRLEDVLRAHVLAERRGVRGVPVFVAARQHAIDGAQPPEVLAALLDLAAVPPVDLAAHPAA